MLPLMLDIAKGKILLVGKGAALKQRYTLLMQAGVTDLTIYVPEAEDAAVLFEGADKTRSVKVHVGVPGDGDVADALLLMVAGIDEAIAEQFASLARSHNVLVNVEDNKRLCDFYMPSLVRRGDLVLAISTGGKSPGLARRLRLKLEDMFGPEWEARLEQIATLRKQWRNDGIELKQLSTKTDELIDKENWL
ncbi:MAG: siroheme synthase [Kordiimonas sp.]|nr:siroheme synthase [Kordiimonas sp.]